MNPIGPHTAMILRDNRKLNSKLIATLEKLIKASFDLCNHEDAMDDCFGCLLFHRVTQILEEAEKFVKDYDAALTRERNDT